MIPAMPDLSGAVAEFERRSAPIPFGNSDYQNRAFVVAVHEGPGRQYRAALLRLSDRLRALREVDFCLQEEAIDLEEAEARIADPSTLDFDRRRAEIKRARILAQRPYTEKLIADAAEEVATLLDVLRRHPEYSREEFEALEHGHWSAHLAKQLQGLTGAAESLDAIGKVPSLAAPTAALPLSAPTEESAR